MTVISPDDQAALDRVRDLHRTSRQNREAYLSALEALAVRIPLRRIALHLGISRQALQDSLRRRQGKGS